jgi:hypothetical protein
MTWLTRGSLLGVVIAGASAIMLAPPAHANILPLDITYFSNTAANLPAVCPWSMRGASDCTGPDDHENYVLPNANGVADGSVTDWALPCDSASPASGNPATANIRDVASLIALLKTYNASADLRKKASSAFIVQSMLNRTGAQANANGGRTISAADWTDVTNRLNAASINWSCTATATDPIRTYGAFDNGINLGDVAAYDSSASPQTGLAIVITGSNGAKYVLFRRCGNPGGNSDGLPPGDYDVRFVAGGTYASTTSAAAGSTVTIHAELDNYGPGTSAPGLLEIKNPGNVANPCVGSCTPASVLPLTGGLGTGSYGYRTNTYGITGYPGNNWFWYTTNMDVPDPPTSATFTATILPTAPLGPLVFRMYYYPADLADTVKIYSVTINVVSVRYPGVSGLNGDVHAGGGVGTACTPNPGTITANPSGKSYGEYVVSASGVGINSFGSNGSTSFGQLLNIGANGGYATICRPDLYAAAYDYRYNTGGTGYVSRAGGSGSGPGGAFIINTDFAGQSIVYIDGDATLHGVVKNKMTIIVTGNLTIDDDIVLDPAATYLPHDAPSLGIIAGGISGTGNINIANAAAEVDAYLFANGIIDTCSPSVDALGLRKACNTVLTVKGFLMGSSVQLHREGTFNASAQNGGAQIIGENVILLPQLYLNPPKFFDGSVDDVLLEGQGERQPLF